MKYLLNITGKVVAVILLFFISSNVFGQELKISGKVTDESHAPMPGVNVLVQGTHTGTITDANGDFSLTLKSPNAILDFSFIGYVTQHIAVQNRTHINIQLVPSAKSLNEVVVVGYGTQKKVNLTGAVGSVQMSDMKDRPLTNASLALQGTIPGVYALQSSGQPGSDNAVIDIRGVGSFQNSSPLVIIDGVPGDLSSVDPNDIASISVLKDAASASIYGNRAANGVILITTKRGAAGKMKISYNAYFGTQQATRLPSVLNSVQYATLYNEASVNSGGTTIYSASDIAKFAAHNDPLYPDINYFDVYYHKANMQNHRLDISGGTDNVHYAFMVGHLDQNGILVGTSYEKTDFRSNVDAYFFKDKRLRISSNIAGSFGVQDQPTDLWDAEWYATLAPVHPLTNANGQWMAVNGERNYYGEVKEGSTSITKNYNFSGQLDAEYKIYKDLSAQVTYGYNANLYNVNAFHANVTLYNPDGSSIPLASDLTVTDGTNIHTLSTALLKYHKKINKNEVSALAGYSEEVYTYDWESGYRSNFVNNTQRVLSLGDAATQTNNAGSYDLALRSYFGRLNYNYDGKYLFEANIRRDGSSRFAVGHQWGTFPSVSGGWIISNEKFMKNISWLNMLKLRASWGQLGNENIGEYYNGYDVLSSGQNYSLGGTLASGVAVTKMTNKNLTWETSQQTDIGVDMSLNNGIDLTADFFDKRTKNLLLPQPIPLTLGALSEPYANAGEVQNRGIEASVTYRTTFGNGFKFRVTANASHIVNKILNLDVPEQLTSPKAIKIGAAINSFYGYKMDGIYQLSDFNYSNGVYTLKPGVVSVSNFTAQPGDIKYKDLNGDGIVDMNNDREVIGKQFPDLTYSLNLNLTWKNFDLLAFFQGVQGIQGYTYYEIATPFSGFANMGSWWMNRWTPTNPSNTLPRLTFDGVRNNIHSSFYMENASYLRLKNIELGYTIDQKYLSKVGISSIRIYGNIQNAFTITKFKGFDPEQTVDQTRAEAFPQVRIMTVGLSVNF
ncbi:SusC/RagA family TonB-linked outer membrane protein [Microbacter margulisiae]|uniref:TonB-linked SusC/RagA family outer membrane protein n=1 Tax=Microbacter margulisiae TaxID=1350067 RepID=A0A7W5H2F3_9PORP|nr:TonB-dependent receptor [Microbacter margulisiae]MBB3187367.1 TonB-linked SusC/RagA family outer membrane protein [Microbacter margulisiae]